MKNLFVLAPLVFAHRLEDRPLLERAGLAFALFCGLYLALDLLYSTATKRVVILDVLSIAPGFAMGVLTGAAAPSSPRFRKQNRAS